MDFSQSFSALNEQLRPRITTSQQLYSSLNRLEDKQWGSLRNQPSSYRSTILPTEPKISVTAAEPEDAGEPGEAADREDSDSDVGDQGTPDKDSLSSSSEEKDISGVLTSKETGESTESVVGESGGNQANFLDGTLPDLIRSGRPLGRRRTLGPVSDTLKEVRREVELSRRRSIKLKAQVDKLQEGRDGPGWSQHRERVTEEVLSVLRLLHPLTESESNLPEPSNGENRLDHALVQLQSVARKLAISQTNQSNSRKGNSEDSAILQQALRDRDEAIEKKKAMEEELLRSKTEMMLLNNQVLEAVQKRLEMSLELEAWKEDVQLMLHQQLQLQQQAEQAQKKPSRLGILRRNNKPMQRPSNFPVAAPAPPVTNPNQIYVSKSAASTPSTSPTQRTWRDKLRRGKSSRPAIDMDASGHDSDCGKGDDFEVVSLD
ncbi:bicaudal-D-related protein 2-like [Xyrichtys novacula]|uniref:Bicaudal-D-related protein 2-like n=1 Tax=Xyrichtys novacula TaxID=13765 RepID=A0AAV1FRN6_XYRNO|nr:bicaudal-D-related protein 2-like [Xyrichtys novacula]